ncbi:MAG: NUDIX domain-containing protein [Magnetococcales bacterium]|nr:NUDIX domain-containing protein [Magnetococcales bacterium]NGZ25295.1 NUDIX domain-containing protein [Magnetococcales bacterium]
MIIRPAALLVREERLLLMVYRYGDQERYNMPGGKLDEGEEIGACLQREWWEELGMKIRLGSLALVAETLVEERQVLHLLFHATSEDEPCLNPVETHASSLLWLPLQKLSEAPLYPAVGEALLDLLVRGVAVPCYQGRVVQHWLK